VVVLSAVRVSPRRLAEFRPLAYLPKPFPLDSLLRLVAEAESRKVGGAPDGQDDAQDFQTYHISEKEELYA
jgi:hypothetical protein